MKIIFGVLIAGWLMAGYVLATSSDSDIEIADIASAVRARLR
jgi:hypothetical protein